MARLPRVSLVGMLQHVIQRGNNRTIGDNHVLGDRAMRNEMARIKEE